MFGITRLYVVLAAAVLMASALGFAALKGYEAGARKEAAKWMAEKIETQQRELAEREAIQAALAKREAEWKSKLTEAANAVADTRVEYAEAKTIVRREVVRLPADCRIGDGLREYINSALAGHPLSGAGNKSDANDSVSL